MKKLLILTFCLLSIFLVTAFASLFGLLTYKDRGYDWQWLGFPIIDSGVQIARTTDTHQLLLRKLYIPQSLEISVYTTMNNKLLLRFSYFDSCHSADEPIVAKLKINQRPADDVTFDCDNTNIYSYRAVVNHLDKATIYINNSNLTVNFDEWNIAEIQKDQFKQLHSDYFKQLGEPSKYQWSRD
ncbi:hypothetical protein A9264_01495 [Vibrio sp. UCD-FRSSP16_10]|uniref:hypothetical protein n=1 Tax=unclassified Vibrio TaxID=2614977 RepID=UPI000800151E|nr:MULTISPECIES: hypothetical protein [unclassified Vibrio]OBT17462.1 hypothetical protein A9260_02945 [Vibrio sp. UCD-FRSSP16_30]OBT23231.1 hypothetical protein A9264_01495 [Vibrio sp. UCD-FRSSP16_10]